MLIAVVSEFQNKKINQKRAAKYCKYVFEQGNIPFAAHLLYPAILNDSNPQERQQGIEAGKAFIKVCNEVWVFAKKGKPYSNGMLQEITFAKANNIHIRYFIVDKNDNITSELDFDDYSKEVVTDFSNIEQALKEGASYEDFSKKLDSILGTELGDRDLEAEEAWELDNRIENN